MPSSGPPPAETTPLLPPGAVAVQVAPPTPPPAQSDEHYMTRAIDWGRLFKFIGPYLVPQTWRLRVFGGLSILFIVLSKLCILLPPFALKLAVDTLAGNALLPPNKRVAPLFAVFLYFAGRALGSMFNTLRSVTYAIVSTANTKRFSVDIFRHLQLLDLEYHIKRKTGEVNRIMDRGAESIDTLMNVVLFTLAPTLLEATLVSAIFLHLGTPIIALVVFLSVLAYGWYTKSVTEIRIRLRRENIEADNAVSGFSKTLTPSRYACIFHAIPHLFSIIEKAVDTLINFETVKMFGMEEFEVASYSDLQQIYLDLTVKLRVTLGALNLGQAVIMSAGVGVSLGLAAISAAHGKLSAGDFVLINAYIAQLFSPLAFLGTSYRVIVRAATDIEKCIKLFETSPEVVDREDAVPLKVSEQDIISESNGEIGFQNVSFRYKTENRSAGGLDNVSFTVKPGRMLGIVGPSGSGKSTLIRICLRLYDPDEGCVTFDGVDIRKFTQQSLRNLYGVVSQDTSLFNRTLQYNIKYGKIGASDADVSSALNAAQLKTFCENLPEKLETMVGERGIRLSGGEKQRVGVARCIIRSPILVLLDEASSSLDSETEREMQASLREVCRGRTTIAVAHRLSTVMMADELIVLDNGKIVERGTHSELLALGGKYAAMWAAQTDADFVKANGKANAL